MARSGLRLSIDYGHTQVAAALCWPDTAPVELAIDGQMVISTGVVVGPDATLSPAPTQKQSIVDAARGYVRIPARHVLTGQPVTVGEVQTDPVDLLAATLSTVAAKAQQTTGAVPTNVLISIPAGWVATQRDAIRAAATRAGLPQPTLVPAAEAIVREQLHHDAPLAQGSLIAVIRFDTTAGEVTLLRYDSEAIDVIANPNLGELGEIEGATLSQQAATALHQVLDVDHIDPEQIHAVYCQVPPRSCPN